MSETTTLIQRLIAKGFSQAEIARRTKIPQPRLSRWANGESPVGANDVLKLVELDQQLSDARDAA